MLRALTLPAMLLALAPFHSSIKPLSASQQAQIKSSGAWHRGCPVPLSGLRLLKVTHVGFDKHRHTGQLVVNKDAAPKLARVFHQLYRLHFPIHHMKFYEVYGPRSGWPKDGDPSGSFECRQAVPSPCTRRQRYRQLVEPRLRPGRRHQPGREPVRRLRNVARPEGAVLP